MKEPMDFRHDNQVQQEPMGSVRKELPDVAVGPMPLPVLRPGLPTAERLIPYLKRIDGSRVYSNFGPLALELEQRLGSCLGLARGCLVTAGSGMSALVGAILGSAGRAGVARPLAVLPSYTFVATASAVEQCGYEPYLADVDQDWQLNPKALLEFPELGRVGLVVPVAPYGRLRDISEWGRFQALTSIPVVIDGAASFDAMESNPAMLSAGIPVAISFHATKSFGTGEGGCVVSTDSALIGRIGQALNFGFHSTRDCATANTNGKMSEYHAAVGLAELDGWNEKRRRMQAVAEQYRQAFGRNGLGRHLHAWPDIALNYALFMAPDRDTSDRIRRELTGNFIDTRLWYGAGLHLQTYFSRLRRDPLPMTDDVAARLIGLPQAPDLSGQDCLRVAEAISKAMAGNA